MAKAIRIEEATHHFHTGRVSLLYPPIDGALATAIPKLTRDREIDLRPSRASRSESFGKRAAVLGRPVGRQEIEVEDGLVEERVTHDDSAKDGFGERCLWLIDGVAHFGTDGDRNLKRPDLAEALARVEAGMVVGEVPHSIVRIPMPARER